MDKERKTTLVPKCQRKWLLTIWHYGAPHHRGRHHSPLGSKERNITVLKFAFIESRKLQIFQPDCFQRTLFPNLFLAFKTPIIMDLGTTPKSSMISASFETWLRYLQTTATKTSVLTTGMQTVWFLQKQGKLVYTDMSLVGLTAIAVSSFMPGKR